MIRPTPRAIAVAVLVFLAAAAIALTTDLGYASLLPFAGLVLLILIDASLLPRARHLALELEVPPYLETGLQAQGKLRLEGARPFPQDLGPDLRVTGSALEFDLGKGKAPDKPEKGQHIWTWPLAVRGQERGASNFTELRLDCRTALGLAQRLVRLPIDQEVVVGVSTKGAKQAALTLQKRGTMFGARAQLAKGQGSEFEAMREFQNGMDPRLIDWKQIAKRGGLIAKEMRLEQNHQVYLVFDTGYLMSTQVDGLSKLDHAINAGLAIGWVASQQGDQVGCFSYDARPRTFAPAKRGKSGYAALKYELGALQPAAVETNPTYGITRLRQRLNRRALVLVFTDFVDTTTSELMVEHLGLMARDHLVAFIAVKNPEVEQAIWQDPSGLNDFSQSIMAADIQTNRQIVLAKLRAAGLFCLDVDPAQLTTDLLNTYLSIRERQLQ